MNHQQIAKVAGGLFDICEQIADTPEEHDSIVCAVLSRFLMHRRVAGTYWSAADMEELAKELVPQQDPVVVAGRAMATHGWDVLDELMATNTSEVVAMLITEAGR